MSGLDERIAVLESQLKHIHTNHTKIMEKLDSISAEMTRYKGFVGGIAFIVSSLLAALTLAKDWIQRNI